MIVGDQNEIMIPSLSRARIGPGRLRGLRLVHTHLKNEPLSKDDLTDLALLRLDIVMAIGASETGDTESAYVAYLNPDREAAEPWIAMDRQDFKSFDFQFDQFVEGLEKELSQKNQRKATKGELRAILAHISNLPKGEAEERLAELTELCETENIIAIDTVIYKGSPNPQNLLGSGRVKDLVIRSLSENADMILFDQELTPAQSRVIGKITDMPILDRTQLILSIFARRAFSADGKLKVELARLKYLLPRLGAKDDALSRIRGGIGMRGPGETVMEVSRRRIKERITAIENKIEKLSHGRDQRRSLRKRSGVTQLSVIGYTNAGKSTLLNALTKSSALVEDKLFATLDPTSRRIRYPKPMDVVLSDTVGFIRDLPEDLLGAFRSTLEELRDADLLLHLVDVSAPDFEHAIETVEHILNKLGLNEIPVLMVLNKTDKAPRQLVENVTKRHGAIAISALDKTGLGKLALEIEAILAAISNNAGQEK